MTLHMVSEKSGGFHMADNVADDDSRIHDYVEDPQRETDDRL